MPYVKVYLSRADYELLSAYCKATSLSCSFFIRDVLRHHLFLFRSPIARVIADSISFSMPDSQA